MAYVNNLLICTPLQAWFTLNMHQIVMWGDMFMDLLGILPCLNPKHSFLCFFLLYISTLSVVKRNEKFCQNWDYICVNGRWRCDIDFLKCNIGYRQVSINWSDNQWDKIINWTHLTLAMHYCQRKTMSICAVWDWQNTKTHTQTSKK